MKPTEEQAEIMKAVLSGKGDIKINAFAGSGKTSTMQMIVRANPQLRFLYVAFNKAVAKEAEAKFPDNCKVYTVHGMAYRSIVPTIPDKKAFNRKLMTTWKLRDYMRHFNMKELEALIPPEEDFYMVCHSIKAIVSNFKYSDRPEISAEHFTLSERAKAYPAELIAKMYEKARAIWEAEIDMKSKVPLDHNTYLKLWELSAPKLKGYDVIINDECQDCNPVMLSIIDQQSHLRKIFCGDNWQAIYGFTNSINAMTAMDTEHNHFLTKSWRFGDAVADEANRVLQILDKTNPPLKGNSTIPSRVGELDYSAPYTMICRTNGALALKAMELISAGKRVYVEGGVKELCADLLALHMLSIKERSTANSKYRPFNFFGEVCEEGKIDVTIKRDLAFIKNFGSDTPAVLEDLENEVLSARNSAKADVILTSAHRSKGLEWNQVKLHDDFKFVVLDQPRNGHFADGQELNLIYVAVTRAKLVLEVNQAYETYIKALTDARDLQL